MKSLNQAIGHFLNHGSGFAMVPVPVRFRSSLHPWMDRMVIHNHNFYFVEFNQILKYYPSRPNTTTSLPQVDVEQFFDDLFRLLLGWCAVNSYRPVFGDNSKFILLLFVALLTLLLFISFLSIDTHICHYLWRLMSGFIYICAVNS